jgi:hypothetical protein
MLQPTSYIIASINGSFELALSAMGISVIDPAPAYAVPNASPSANYRTRVSTWRCNARMSYPREHCWSAVLRSENKGFHRGLPFFGIVFCLWQFGDVEGGVA